jgi:SEC-C motif-containing protein
MINCPCGSQIKFVICCEPYLMHKKIPDTPEALMRSRYTAYSLANIDYIQETMQGKAISEFNAVDAKRWARKVVWIQLSVLYAMVDGVGKGYVEFKATLVVGQILKVIHEKSEFVQEQGRWYYVDGVHFPSSYISISRNSACPCGSESKYKNCHGKK